MECAVTVSPSSSHFIPFPPPQRNAQLKRSRYVGPKSPVELHVHGCGNGDKAGAVQVRRKGGQCDQRKTTSKFHCGNPTLETRQKMRASTNVNVTG